MNVFDRIAELLERADNRGDSCEEIDEVLHILAENKKEPGDRLRHSWTDDWGNSRSSEIMSSFDRGEFHWVTVWDERACSFRTLPDGAKTLYGREAYETLSDDEQTIVFNMAMDEAADMSSRERAFEMIDDMDLGSMKDWIKDARDD